MSEIVEALPEASLLRPAHWPARCGAVMSTRLGGASRAPFDSLNLRAQVDDPDELLAVADNRRRFAATLGARPVFLDQVHGIRVVRLAAEHAAVGAPVERADASVTTVPGLACTVLVADCLPVLLAARNGRAVGAAHAGWRGLAAGVLEATVDDVRAAAQVPASDVVAWLGACIGPSRFEVGDDVRDAFRDHEQRHFTEAPARDGVRKWFADLPGLARGRLRRLGVAEISGGDLCTASDASRFFSYRRDGLTGRLAAAAWIDPV